MVNSLLPFPRFRALDADGNPLALGKVYTYEPGTTTPKTTYTDADAGTPNANPVILDSQGYADIWGDGAYKILVKTSADATLYTIDDVGTATTLTGLTAVSATTGTFTNLPGSPIITTPVITSGTYANAHTVSASTKTSAGAYTVLSSDYVVLINKSSGAATTVNLPAAASNSGRVLIIKDAKGDANTNNITIDPNSTELVDGASTLVISTAYGKATLYCNGTAWFSI